MSTFLGREDAKHLSLTSHYLRSVTIARIFHSTTLISDSKLMHFLETLLSSEQIPAGQFGSNGIPIRSRIDYSSSHISSAIKRTVLFAMLFDEHPKDDRYELPETLWQLWQDKTGSKPDKAFLHRLYVVLGLVPNLEELEIHLYYRVTPLSLALCIGTWTSNLKVLILNARLVPTSFTTILNGCSRLHSLYFDGFLADESGITNDQGKDVISSVAEMLLDHPSLHEIHIKPPCELDAHDPKQYRLLSEILQCLAKMSSSRKQSTSLTDVYFNKCNLTYQSLINVLTSPAFANVKFMNLAYYDFGDMLEYFGEKPAHIEWIEDGSERRYNLNRSNQGILKLEIWTANIHEAFYRIVGPRIGILLCHWEEYGRDNTFDNLTSAIVSNHLCNLKRLHINRSRKRSVMDQEQIERLERAIKRYGNDFDLAVGKDLF